MSIITTSNKISCLGTDTKDQAGFARMEKFSGFYTTDEPIELPPGFRFHPTDEELITHYLTPKVLDSSFITEAIGDVDLNKIEPWDLPWKAKMGEKEWYFFCVRDRKYPTGLRTNRATDAGYWKATGKDKEIFREKISVGTKKTLVFYRGRAPRGEKSNWVMHEYRLGGKHSMDNLPNNAKKEWVICRIFKKSSGGKKVHISGLVRRTNCSANSQTSDLPALMEFSPNENQTRITADAEGSHVTCFSNPMDDPQDKFLAVSNSNSNFSSQMIQFTGNFHYPDSVSMQDESMLRLLLENNSPCMKQNAKVELSEDLSSNHEVGFKPHEDQEFQNVYSGQVDFDCWWNY